MGLEFLSYCIWLLCFVLFPGLVFFFFLCPYAFLALGYQAVYSLMFF